MPRSGPNTPDLVRRRRVPSRVPSITCVPHPVTQSPSHPVTQSPGHPVSQYSSFEALTSNRNPNPNNAPPDSTVVRNFGVGVRVDRRGRRLVVDEGRGAEATPAVCRGKDVVLFVESVKQ